MARPVGGGGDAVPPGTIYFADYDMITYDIGTFPSFTGVYSMKGDGSGKTLVSTDFPRDPSRLLHGERWVLDTRTVSGAYPNGTARREIFAAPLSGGTPIQLTDNPDVQPGEVSWSANDSFISFAGVTWNGVTTCGNYTDSGGSQWFEDAEVFRADLNWGSVLSAGAPTAVLDVGETFNNWGSGIEISSNATGLDWSRDGTKLVYQKTVNESHTLHVASFNATLDLLGTVNLGPGRDPEFSPEGSRVAYSAADASLSANTAIWTANPDGTGVFRVTKTAQQYDSRPGWSPDGKHIVFSRYTLPKGYKAGVSRRVPRRCRRRHRIELAKDSEYAQAMAWRSDVQATTAFSTASATSTSTSLFSAEPVNDSTDSDDDRLMDLLIL